MGIGQINAGSSVALTAMAGELAGILSKLQQEQIEAAATVSNAQGVAAAASATATISAAQSQANQIWCDFAQAAVGVGTSAISVGMASKAANDMGNAFKEKNTQIEALGKMKSNLKPNVDGHLVGGDLAPAPLDPINKTRIKNHFKDTLKKIRSGIVTTTEGISAGNAARLTDIERKQMLDEISPLLDTEARAGSITSAYESKIKVLENTHKKREALVNVLSKVGDTATLGAKTASINSQGAENAIKEIQGQLSQQLGQAFQQIVDARSKLADEIAQILNAKNSAIQAVVQTQG